MRNRGNGLEWQRIFEVIDDVVDHSVHPLNVVERGVVIVFG